jgi:dienelactone hydrolase
MAQVPTEDIRNKYLPHTDTHFKAPVHKSKAAWEARRLHLRNQILASAGLLPLPVRTPLKPRIIPSVERADYSIEKVLLETFPGFVLGGNLYRPRGRTGKFPGVVSPHGHWKQGRLEDSETGSIPARCINLARQGYVVFAYDMVGYNDTKQTPHRFEDRTQLLWSFHPLALQLWNSIRAVDFVSGLPDVDKDRIAATGASGGGTQTFLLTAVDDRVRYSAPVNMISTIMQGGCVCENAPGLRIGTFNVEIASLMAPRPMLMVSATGDWTRNTPREEFPGVRHVYELYGKPELLETIHIDAPHNYNRASREAVYRFFAKHILGRRDAASLAEEPYERQTEDQLLALKNSEYPADSFEKVFEAWKAAGPSAPKTKEQLAFYLTVQRTPEVVVEREGERFALGRRGVGDRVHGMWLGPDKLSRPVVVVHPEGSEVARTLSLIEKLKTANRTVILIDAFQTGAAKAPRDRSHKFFLTFNQGDNAARVQDIVTTLRYLETQGSGTAALACPGAAGTWCLFAAAVAGNDTTVFTDGRFPESDADYLEHFYLPGLQRAGGVAAARRLVQVRSFNEL